MRKRILSLLLALVLVAGLLPVQRAAAVGTPQSAADLLAQIPYVGDLSKCKMTAEQARAFAEKIDETGSSQTVADGSSEVALFDAGNGIPALWIVQSRESQIWEWDGRKAVETRYPAVAENGTLIERDGKLYLRYYVFGGGIDSLGRLIFSFQNGRLAPKTVAQSLEGRYGPKTAQSLAEEINFGNIPAAVYDIPTLNPSDWKQERDSEYIIHIKDGKIVPAEQSGLDPEWRQDSELLSCNFTEGPVEMYGPWDGGGNTAATLRAFADFGPSYTFPAVTDDAARVKAIADAVAAQLGGEITALYQMADGLWYVIITVDGTVKGAVVQAVKSGGKLTYEVLERHDAPAAEETLQNLANDFRSKPNLTPDYAATEEFTTVKEYEDYLKKLLDNIPGGAPNDAAKGELAAFLENSVSRVSTVTVPAKGNRVTLTGSDISAGCASAKEAGDALQGVLTGDEVSLNKALTIIIRVECQGLDSGKPLQLDLDKSLLDTLGDAELMLLLGDGSHAVRLTAADLQALIDAYGTLSIQLEKTGDAAYTINFLDSAGEIITRLCANVSFLLPASGPLATVLASYEGGSDNWGGQYDERTAAIRFSTPYSGVYEIMENDLTISDLEGLSEEQRTAVAFMVSKGYFTLDGSNAFRPGVSLTRYDFTKALVGMFFALERDLPTTFADVPADSPYRDAVASAQAKNLIKGYSETKFAGEDNISGEQVLTLAGRTLVERKRYTYPADPAQHLTFPGGAEVDDWAQEATALAVREGVLAPGERLAPLADLSRADAALYLYRLFMLLYETSPEAIQMQTPPETIQTPKPPETTQTPTPPEKPAAAVPVIPIVLAVGGVAAVTGGIALWVLLKRKKTSGK